MKANLSPKELWGMDPNELGRDGWMSGDINVEDNIEFVPRVPKVYVLTGNQEVDLSKLSYQIKIELHFFLYIKM